MHCTRLRRNRWKRDTNPKSHRQHRNGQPRKHIHPTQTIFSTCHTIRTILIQFTIGKSRSNNWFSLGMAQYRSTLCNKLIQMFSSKSPTFHLICSDVYEGQCDVPVESSFEQLFDTKGDSSPYAASSFQMLETCAEIAINAYDDQPEEQTLLADDNDADCMSLESPNENVSAKKYTFNPLSKPFEPARTSCSTSDYCSQSDSTSSKSQSPLPVQSESDASDCPSSSSSSSSQSLSTSSPSPKKTPLATTTHLSATGNLKQVFQSFFDAHSMQSTVTKDTTTTATTQSKLRKPTKTKFVCVLCSEQFRTVDELRKHILDKILKSYECIICGETYTHKYLMQRHRASHRSMPQFPCRGCSKKFRSFVQLDKHFDTCRFKLYIYA